ncbi:uncharacterized protein LOC111040844 [Myzus persicae]|uniref:uncharacterized protein LOC111040844 n=1 Tax=Myzus persicae TaxID=13164 RepID=UPI000B938728|nr:uncharacterized protein LOC111040844 [Myzus persicae]
MNHMELVTAPNPNKCAYYFPHHAVMKESSITTKLRVVFDGSAPSSSGLSLNDILFRGPKVQPDLLDILLGFRMHSIVITADIAKMYRQAASFLSTRCLLQLANEVEDPSLKRVISSDFYVDDLLTGCSSEDACYSLYKNVNKVLEAAGFPLRKWCSNSSSLMSRIPKDTDNATYRLSLTHQDTANTLGLSWQPSTDTFHFSLGTWNPPAHMTKRSLLSDINRIFDPIGLITPILIKGKIFLQQLWLLKLSWDSILPADLQARWINFYSSLESLDKLSISRKVTIDGESTIT